MTTMTDEELAQIITEQLPGLLAKKPLLTVPLYNVFLNSFVERNEFGQLQQELGEFRSETRQEFRRMDQRFEQVDQRFEQVDQRFERLEQNVAEGFKRLETQIDRLGQRWGIRNESLFRQTMAALLEESFGVKVQRKQIKDEEFDVLISNGEHILVEITASVKRTIQERLERKRKLYTEATGITPVRFILAVASIHSHRAAALRQAGFDVIEPAEEDLEED